jgi:hypothetical protein
VQDRNEKALETLQFSGCILDITVLITHHNNQPKYYLNKLKHIKNNYYFTVVRFDYTVIRIEKKVNIYITHLYVIMKLKTSA